MITVKQILIPVVLAMCSCMAHAELQQNSAVEAAIVRHVDERQGPALALLELAVNTNSGSLNFPGVGVVAARFRAEFDEIGFRTRWLDGSRFGQSAFRAACTPSDPFSFIGFRVVLAPVSVSDP